MWSIQITGYKETKQIFNMTPLNLHHIRLISIILLVALQITCSTNDKNENDKFVLNIDDTLNYGEKDYNLMREYFNADSVFISTITKGVSVGDTNSMKIQKLLITDYELRDKTGLTDSEINALIFSYHTTKNVLNRFNEIEKRLPKTKAEAIRAKTDSIVNSLESIKKDLK